VDNGADRKEVTVRTIALLCALAAAAVSGCRSKTPPPPATAAFLREPIAFDAAIEGEGSDIVKELVKFARLFGFPPVGKDEEPAYIVRGRIALAEIEPATFEGQVLEYKFQADIALQLAPGAGGAAVETFELPEFVTGAAEKDRALRNAVRAVALKLAQFMFYDGETLGDPALRSLCGELLIENTEGLLYNDVVEKLVAAGYRAVPFLIWNLNDSRKVELEGDLPRLREEDAGKVRVHHVANYALERIFGASTGLTVASGRREIGEATVEWQRRWRERCGAYLWGEKLRAALAARAQAPAAAPHAEGAQAGGTPPP